MEKESMRLLNRLFSEMGNGFYAREDSPKVVKCRLYYRNNPNGTLRWVWPANLNRPVFLKFYNDSSRRASLLARMIRLLFFFRLQRFFASGSFYVLFEESRNETFLQKLGKDWALFAGTPGLNQAALFYGKGRFFKIPVGEQAENLIRHEHRSLQKWKNFEFKTIRIPDHSYQYPVLEQEDVAVSAIRTSSVTDVHWRGLAELSAVNQSTVVLKIMPEWKQTERKLEALAVSEDGRIPKGIVTKLRRLMLSINQDAVIPASSCHGDFTPWNMFVSGEQLALIDWELSKNCAPVFFDLFHFFYQQGALVDHSGYEKVKQEISAALSHPTAKKITNAYHADTLLHEKLYLLFTTTYYLDVYSRQESWHPQVAMSLRFWNEALNHQLTNNVFTKRELFLYDLFDHLQNIPYAALKWLNAGPDSVPEYGDIDLCIRKEDKKPLAQFLRKHPFTARVKEYRKSFMSNFSIVLNDGSFVSLDTIWQFKRKGLVMLDAASVLDKAITNSYGIKRPCVADDFSYTWLFYSLNKSDVPEKYRLHFSFFSSVWRTRLNETCAWVKATGVRQYSDLYAYNAKNRELAVRELMNLKFNKGFSGLMNRLRYKSDMIREQFFHRGFIITFSGVDGAGKSTIIERVKYLIEKKYRRKVVVLRHRPAVLPMLSAWKEGRQAAEQKAAERLPRQGSNKSLISSLIRFAYYYSDYMLGQFYIQAKYVWRGYVVLYDRYYFDFINDGKRSNINLPAGFTRYGYSFLLKPRINFFLYADPATILNRKKELDRETISELTEKYLQLFRRLGKAKRRSKYIPIRNEVLPQTLHTIQQHIIKAAI